MQDMCNKLPRVKKNKNTMFNVYLDMLMCGSPIIENMNYYYELIINYHNESTLRRQWLPKPILMKC